jgi:hypothetical protein
MSRFVRMLKPAWHVLRCALVLGLCGVMTSLANAQSNAHQHFGKVHFPLACSDGVQEQFDLALAMLHTFSFPDAAKTFTAVAQKDPDCAMAYWGIAATAIGSLYGGRPGPMALQGEQAVEKAKAIGGRNARERDYIATIEVFYRGASLITQRACVPMPLLWSNCTASIPKTTRPRFFMPTLCRPWARRPTRPSRISLRAPLSSKSCLPSYLIILAWSIISFTPTTIRHTPRAGSRPLFG